MRIGPATALALTLILSPSFGAVAAAAAEPAPPAATPTPAPTPAPTSAPDPAPTSAPDPAPSPSAEAEAAADPDAKMHMMRPDDMLYCHLVAERALRSGRTGLMVEEDYENVSRLARTAKGIQVLEQINEASFRGFSDYIAREMWNAARLRNQEAIAATDTREVAAVERFLTACLINIANLSLGTAEAYRARALRQR